MGRAMANSDNACAGLLVLRQRAGSKRRSRQTALELTMPPKDETYTRTLQVRVSAKTAQLANETAAAAGLTLSDWLRSVISANVGRLRLRLRKTGT